MFRKRRQRDDSSATAAAGAAPAPPLVEKLREIGLSAAAPEDALEPAIRVLVEAMGAGAGALCLFDPRYGVLRLAAESGLSDEGCRRLRNVRRGDPGSWDMPLHGVLNRRAYLIESAAKNRYVPHLVEHFASVRSVICVPVYGGPVPLGTVVLVAVGARTFSEGDIHALERPLRELAKLVEAVRRRVAPVLEAFPTLLGVPQDYSGVVEERDHLRAEMASRFAEHASLASELTARTQENDGLRLTIEKLTEERARLQAALEQGRGSNERVEELSDALAAAERERARLAAALEAAAFERSEAVRRETAVDAARAEAQRIAREAAAELEAARKAQARTAMDAAAEIDERTAEVEQLRAYIVELESAAERDRTAAHERQREHERLASELRAATAREQQARAELAGTVERLESAGGDAVREAAAERSALAAELEAARASLAEQRAAFEHAEAESARLRSELARLETTEASRRAEDHRAQAALDDAQARARKAEERLGELERAATTLRESGDRTIADSRERAAELAAVSAHLESVAAERDRLREARAAVESERDALMSELAASAAKLTRVEESLLREAGERERLAEALHVAQSALAALESGRSDRPLPVGRVVERPAPGREPAAPAAEPSRARDTMRVLTVAPTGGRTRARDGGEQRIAVLDVDPIWESASIKGYQVMVVSPEEDAAGALAEIEPSRVVVNLAAPGAMEAVAALRGAGSESKVWGCIGVAADRAIPVGVVEVAARPLDCDAILDILKGYTSRGTRVVTAGADVDTLMSLRQAMARLGMSVSMAWDAKQATDLLTVVRPEVVVLDLDLPRQAGYGILARLSLGNPVPTAVIVPGKEDATDAFAATLAQPGMQDLAVPRDRLLADAIGRQDSAAQERRMQKIRAVGRK